MNNLNYGAWGGDFVGMMNSYSFWPTLTLLVLWSLFWKGLALWHSGKRSEPWWFIAILIVNSVGILEIVYLFFIIKLKVKDLFTV